MAESNSSLALASYRSAKKEYDQSGGVGQGLLDFVATRSPLADAFIDTTKEKHGRAREAYLDYQIEKGIEQDVVKDQIVQNQLTLSNNRVSRMDADNAYQDKVRANALETQKMALKQAKRVDNIKDYSHSRNMRTQFVTDQISSIIKKSGLELDDQGIKGLTNIPDVQRLIDFDTAVVEFMKGDLGSFKIAAARAGGWFNEAKGTIDIPKYGIKGAPATAETFEKIVPLMYQKTAEAVKAAATLKSMDANYATKPIHDLTNELMKTGDYDGDYVKAMKQTEAFLKPFSGVQKRHHSLTLAMKDILEKGGAVGEDKIAQAMFLADKVGYEAFEDPQGGVLVKKKHGNSTAVPLADFYKSWRANDTILKESEKFLVATGAQQLTEKNKQEMNAYDNAYGTKIGKLAAKDPGQAQHWLKEIKGAMNIAQDIYAKTGDIWQASKEYDEAVKQMKIPKELVPNLYGDIDSKKELVALEKKKKALEKDWRSAPWAKDKRQNILDQMESEGDMAIFDPGGSHYDGQYASTKEDIAYKLIGIDEEMATKRKTMEKGDERLPKRQKEARDKILESM